MRLHLLCLASCTSMQSGVVIEEVVDTLDFSAYFRGDGAEASPLDPAFGGFGCTGPRGDEDAGTRVPGTAGYHLLNIALGPAPGTSVAHFKRYQQGVFNTIAFDPSDLPARDRAEPRQFPCVLAVVSDPEPVTVLLRQPTGQLALAPRAEEWRAKLEKTVRKIGGGGLRPGGPRPLLGHHRRPPPAHRQWLKLTADSQRAVHLALGNSVV